MPGILRRIIGKALRLVSATRFRLKHRLLGGSVQVDAGSIARVSLGRGVTLRGRISVDRAALRIGARCSIAKTAQVGCAGDGAVILHEGVSIGPRSIVSTTAGRVEIGANTSFFSDCIITGEVTIGPSCLFANNITVLTGTHEIYGTGTIRENDAAASRQLGYRPYRPVWIGADCWLGANSVVLPGVTLGQGCVVGANAVVTKSFPDYSILAGVPAAVIGSRRDGKKK
jgi:acetyltransferase-like isoleucine patch superfamily enzyme